MKHVLRGFLLAASVTLLAPLSANASLQTLSDLFVFGDSLSDGGNYAGPGGPGSFPPAPYSGARYSNGPTAVEYLWQSYHPGSTTFKPSNLGGTNYALGGATTGSFNFNSISPNVPPSLRPWFGSQGGVANQVAQFAGSCNGCFNAANSLFVVWAFPNDVFTNAALGAGGLPPAKLIANGVSNIVGAIQTLASKGAQHFLVPNMADLGAVPDFHGNASLTAFTIAFDQALAAALTALDQALSAEITQFDTFSAVNKVIQNPATYGFTNVTDACLSSAACNPATWLFWDGVHPTTAAHAILGAQFAAAVPEPATLWLIVAALVFLAFSRRTKRRYTTDA